MKLRAAAYLQSLTGRHELAVNVDFTKLVLNDSNALAVFASQDVVQQSGFAAAQKPSNDLQHKEGREEEGNAM